MELRKEMIKMSSLQSQNSHEVEELQKTYNLTLEKERERYSKDLLSLKHELSQFKMQNTSLYDEVHHLRDVVSRQVTPKPSPFLRESSARSSKESDINNIISKYLHRGEPLSARNLSERSKEKKTSKRVPISVKRLPETRFSDILKSELDSVVGELNLELEMEKAFEEKKEKG